MTDIKFNKGDISLVVTEQDLQEYYDWQAGNKNETRVLAILNNDICEYEDLMGLYAELIA